MKKALLFFAMLLSVIAVSAKDVKTVVFTTNPIMHCANCENKIKTNLRYEKGVKSIETNVDEQRVTVSYDPSKTNAETIKKAFTKFGYEATTITGGEKADCCKAEKKEGCGGCKAEKKEGCGGCKAEKKEGCGGCKAEKKEGCGGCKAENKEGCGGCKAEKKEGCESNK